MTYGSFGRFVERELPPYIEASAMHREDKIDVVATLRACEKDGTLERAAG